MKLTQEHLNLAKSSRGAWSKKQLTLLGLPWPIEGGMFGDWQSLVLGKDYPDDTVNQFVALKDQHFNKPRNKRLDPALSSDPSLVFSAELNKIGLNKIPASPPNLIKNQTTIYTDGSCDPNPGPGSWAVVIYIDDRCIELAGTCSQTTNNRMEMQAILEALRYSKAAALPDCVIYSDSLIVVNGLTGVWGRKSNLDIWAELGTLYDQVQPRVLWVKGHAGCAGNERADELASQILRRTYAKA